MNIKELKLGQSITVAQGTDITVPKESPLKVECPHCNEQVTSCDLTDEDGYKYHEPCRERGPFALRDGATQKLVPEWGYWAW